MLFKHAFFISVFLPALLFNDEYCTDPWSKDCGLDSGPTEISIYIGHLCFFLWGEHCVEMSFRQTFIGKQNQTEKEKYEMIWYFSNATANSMPHRVRFLSTQIPQKEIDFEVIYQILDYLRLFSYFQTLSGVSKNYQNLIKMKSKFMLRF